jgi:hypothetical protein
LKPIFHPNSTRTVLGEMPNRRWSKWKSCCFRGHPEVVDADLADYFGSIPHADLLKSVARRIVDRRVLHLIKMWLECPVEETDDRGRKTRTTEARDKRRGIPQGLGDLSKCLTSLSWAKYFPPPAPRHSWDSPCLASLTQTTTFRYVRSKDRRRCRKRACSAASHAFYRNG